MGDPLTFTIDEFCRAVRISRSAYYTLPKRPREMRVGPKRVLISREAATEWIREHEGRNAPAAA